jgi:hypothetical protein
MTQITQGERRDALLESLAAILDQARIQRRTMTYLQVADALAIEAPQRIHKTTRLIEILLKRDSLAGQPIRAALIISRTGSGRPAVGFFERARRLGLFDGENPERFHDRLLEELFDRPPHTDTR